MSYCRFSSMDFGCDLYCYESEEGFVTHVAGNRVVGEVPRVNFGADAQTIAAQMATQLHFLRGAERAAIELPCAGETFVDKAARDFLARLIALRRLGYRFPDSVFERVHREMAHDFFEETMTDEQLWQVIERHCGMWPRESFIMAKLFAVASEIRSAFERRGEEFLLAIHDDLAAPTA